ncbi:MAG TPA: metallophosphoesterase [Thermodesulfovibrionales bacterium]|nr:metallophosphoesterase [Thermodesulfovibrionales bacterium]
MNKLTMEVTMCGNTKTFERSRLYILILITVLYACILVSCSSNNGGTDSGRHGEALRFVFMADSRSDSYGPEPVVPENFINSTVLTPIVKKILDLRPRPSFVVFGGDMAYRGRYQHHSTSFYTFQAWKNVMKPLTDAGIPVYTAIGNHELYDTHGGTFSLANQKEFQATFTDNPSNGPAGYERLVYSFTSPKGDSFFAVLDPYYITADVPMSESESESLHGEIDDTQMNWLADQLARTNATHKFLFVHTPYYYMGGQPNPAPNGFVSFTNLWNMLDSNMFDLYACGHSHLYSRKTIDSSVAPDPQTNPPLPPWKNNVVQLLNGTCGAPLDAVAPVVDPSAWHVFNQLNKPDTYYFSVVDINGSHTTVNSYGYNIDTTAFSIIDTFRIQKNTSPQIVAQRRKGEKLAKFIGR